MQLLRDRATQSWAKEGEYPAVSHMGSFGTVLQVQDAGGPLPI